MYDKYDGIQKTHMITRLVGPLPAGWDEALDMALGKKYYIDHTHKRTT